MTQDKTLFAPRADSVDGELFIETEATARVTASLWTLLGLTRQEPRPWIPMTVLCGEPGSGLTTITKRFVTATQRNASCDYIRSREQAAGPDEDWATRDARMLAHGVNWSEQMVRDFGACLAHCAPVAEVPEHLIQLAIREAQNVHPAVRMQMGPRPDREGVSFGDSLWRSPGNVTHHPTRRTSVLMVDDADRILAVPATRRREVLDRIQEWEKVIRHDLAVVLIGSPALGDAVAESRTNQVIRLTPLAGEEFSKVCGLLFGTRDPEEVAALHEASRGLMGRLVHLARLRGLQPPYHVPPEEIVTLRALSAPDGRP